MNRAAPFLLIGGLVLAAAPHATADDTVVVYSVTSDGPLSNLTYLDANSNRQQLTGVSTPWSITVTNPQPNRGYEVTARTTGTQVSCSISVNGRIIDRDSDNDGTADVDCHEGFDDD